MQTSLTTRWSNQLTFSTSFFTKDIIDLMVKQTNIYREKKSSLQNRLNTWQSVDENTIRSFLGLLIIIWVCISYHE